MYNTMSYHFCINIIPRVEPKFRMPIPNAHHDYTSSCRLSATSRIDRTLLYVRLESDLEAILLGLMRVRIRLLLRLLLLLRQSQLLSRYNPLVLGHNLLSVVR